MHSKPKQLTQIFKAKLIISLFFTFILIWILLWQGDVLSWKHSGKSHLLFCHFGGQFPLRMTAFLQKSSSVFCTWPLFPSTPFGVSLDCWKLHRIQSLKPEIADFNQHLPNGWPWMRYLACLELITSSSTNLLKLICDPKPPSKRIRSCDKTLGDPYNCIFIFKLEIIMSIQIFSLYILI